MPVTTPAIRLLRFDVFELDIRAGELRKKNRKLKLQGQPLEVLAVLLQRAGDVVTREELRTKIWTADTFIDFDHSLHNAVARLREVLGDSAETPRFIETLPRRGYRFIGRVEEVGTETPGQSMPIAPPKETPARERPIKIRPVLVLPLFTILAILLSLWLLPMFSRRTSAAIPLRSIAVLPLENLTGDPSQNYFVDGMTDELTTDLAKVSSLHVISRTSAMRYKNTKKGLPEIAKELKVDGIVEGSVLRSGDRVRITAQLINAPTDQHLWAESYERDLGDVLRLQSEVAQAIAQQVRATLTPQQQARFSSTPSVNPEGYEAYLRGRYYLTAQFTTADPLNKAKSYFEESIKKDPGFALGYSGLADAYLYLTLFHQLSPELGYQLATQALHKALELDDSIGETHDTLGVLRWRYEWNWDAAKGEFDHAIALAPSYSCAREDRAEYLAFAGRRAEVLGEIAKINEMDPGPSSAMTESGAYFQLRDYAGLIEVSRRGIISNPTEWLEYYDLGVGYEGTGKRLEAIAEYQKAVELSGGDQDATAALAHSYAMIGRRSEAEKMLRDLERKSKNDYVSPYVIATIYAGLGDKDKAFEFLEKAYQQRSMDIAWEIKADVRIDNLRSDPRFQNLLHRIGLTS